MDSEDLLCIRYKNTFSTNAVTFLPSISSDIYETILLFPGFKAKSFQTYTEKIGTIKKTGAIIGCIKILDTLI